MRKTVPMSIRLPAEKAVDLKKAIYKLVKGDDPVYKVIEANPDLTASEIRRLLYAQGQDKMERVIKSQAKRWGLTIAKDKKK